MVSLSPHAALRHDSSSGGLNGSLLSLDSLLLANLDTVSQSSSACGAGHGALSTPDPPRRTGVAGSLQKAMGAVRSSQGAGKNKSMTSMFIIVKLIY